MFTIRFLKQAMTFGALLFKLNQKSKAFRKFCFVGLKHDIFDVIKNVMYTSGFTLKY